jgi:ribonuclease P protein component
VCTTLRRNKILRNKKTFRDTFYHGVKYQRELLRAYINVKSGENIEKKFQVGFTVSNIIRSAVRRNFFKRLIREAFRINQNILLEVLKENSETAEIVFCYQPRFGKQHTNPKFHEIEKEVKSIIQFTITLVTGK